MKKWLSGLLTVSILLTCALPARCASPEEDDLLDGAEVSQTVFSETGEPSLEVSVPSAILMEQETGEVLFEKDADERLSPASVTKVMTILLTAEAIESGLAAKEETVTASAAAAGMGGSQIFLAEGETMSLEDLLKSVVIASANDAAVAIAEHLCGTESAFVSRMNERACELGCENTHFVNCTGLTESDDHYITVRDVAIMSREVLRHAWLREYTTTWMDSVRGGEFGLTNTNKLVRFYEGATGLKTGFTQKAGFCLSATAERDGMELIAVVFHGATSEDRFESAKSLLSYGFANFAVVSASPDCALPPIPVTLGKSKTVQPVYEEEKSVLVAKGEASSVTREVWLPDEVEAPISAGEEIGYVLVKCGGEEILRYSLCAAESVEKYSFWEIALRLLAICLGAFTNI